MTDDLHEDTTRVASILSNAGGPSKEAEAEATAKKHGERMRRHLTGSIYLWACGEKSETDDEDLDLSDVLIGWLVPLLQGLAYIVLIVRVDQSQDTAEDLEEDSDSEKDSSGSNYSLASITGAMYLLVASTTPDLRAGFSLLVDGLHPYHHAFGFVVLTLYALMITAAMTVLFADANDDASVVINAVTVLFIADVDEKALSFFSTVPQRWRLFWAIYTVGISFALALFGLIYVGNPSETVDVGSSVDLNVFDWVPGWFTCTVNPGAVTVCSFYLSAAVKTIADACAQTDGDAGVPKWRIMLAMVIVRSYKVVASAKDFFRDNPVFCVVVFLWLVHGVVSWWFLVRAFWRPLLMCSEFSVDPSNDSTDSAVGSNSTTTTSSLTVGSVDTFGINMALMVANIALGIGSVMKLVGICVRVKRRPRSQNEPRRFADMFDVAPLQSCGRFECTFLPSLLFGWGVGYWITSVLMGSSIYTGGWKDMPLPLKIVSYTTLPWFFVAAIFLMADKDFLGAKFEPFVKDITSTLKEPDGICFWILTTVIRDVLFIWVFMWYVLVPCLNNI